MTNVGVVETRFNNVEIVPIGDVHMGDRNFNEESRNKLMGYVRWIEKRPNAYAFLMGDLLNCATRDSRSSPFQQNMTLDEQINEIVKILYPIRKKIVGAITGNHEDRLRDNTGYDPTISICDRLGCYYYNYDAVIIFRLGCHGNKKTPRGSFAGYFHHTTGGGTTIGGKLNRIEKLKNIVCNADFYVGGHNHCLITAWDGALVVDLVHARLDFARRALVDAGSYLSYKDSYANAKMLSPAKLGSPKITLILKRDGKDKVRKDIHVSI